MKKIQKSQASGTYDGIFVSCCSFITKNQYNLLFTDNQKNYASNGIYIATKKVYGNPIFPKNNIVSRVSINIENSDPKREQFL